MRVNTVILPIMRTVGCDKDGNIVKEPTGFHAEFRGGQQISEPFKLPSMPSPETVHALKVQGLLSDPTPSHARVTIAAPDRRTAADHYRRAGETTEQAADRLADAASRFEINKQGAAVAAADASGVRYLSGNG